MRHEKDRSLGFTGLSILAHASIALGVTLTPNLEMLPEGTVGMTTIEFTALEAPQGNQIKTIDVGEVEDKAPAISENIPEINKQPTVNEDPNPVVIAKKEPAKKKKQKAKQEKVEIEKPKVEIAETETIEESPVETLVPVEELTKSEKLEVEELKEIEDEFQAADVADLEDSETGIEREEEIKQAEEDSLSETLAAVEQEKALEETVQEEPTPPAKVAAVPKPSPEKAAQNVRENRKANPQKNALAESNKAKAKGTTHQSNLNYGVPTGIRDVKDLTQVPGNLPPQYPQEARLRRQAGKVKLLYYVTSDGRVANLRLQQSSGFQVLDQEAISAISKYRFRPGQQGYTSHEVIFNLRGDATPAGGRLRTSARDLSKPAVN